MSKDPRMKAIPFEQFEVDGTTMYTNPLNPRSQNPSAPVYEGVALTEVEAEEYHLHRDQPQAAGIEADLLTVQAQTAVLRNKNLVTEANLTVVYDGGDANVPGGIGGREIKENTWKNAKTRTDSAINESSKNAPHDVPTWDPKYDIEGPSPLDYVEAESTRYELPKGHGVDEPYQFGSIPTEKHEEYKSVYD